MKSKVFKNVNAEKYSLIFKVGSLRGITNIHFLAKKKVSFAFILSNKSGEKLMAG